MLTMVYLWKPCSFIAFGISADSFMNLKNLLLFEGENTPVLEHRDVNSNLWAWIMEHWADIQHLFRSSNGAAALPTYSDVEWWQLGNPCSCTKTESACSIPICILVVTTRHELQQFSIFTQFGSIAEMPDISGDAEMSDISRIQIVSEVSVSCSVAIERTKQKCGRRIPMDV